MATMVSFTKLATAGALAALLAGTPAFAQMAWEEEGWDRDGDGLFSMDEFREGFRERINFAEWDADADGLLSEEEFGGGLYSRYDRDRTEVFEETEYGAFERDFGEEGIWGANRLGMAEEDELAEGTVLGAEDEGLEGEGFAELEAWDVDGDGVLLRNEFEDGFREWGTFGEFDVDRDGGITEDELTEGIFTRYDEDGTGFIEEPELTDIGDDIGDEGFWDV